MIRKGICSNTENNHPKMVEREEVLNEEAYHLLAVNFGKKKEKKGKEYNETKNRTTAGRESMKED